MQEAERHVTKRERLTVAHFVMLESNVRVRPGNYSHSGLRQFARTRHEIGVHVRLDRRNDGCALLPRRIEIDRHVAARIDDDRLPGPIAPDEKRRLRQPLIEESLEHAIEFRAIPPKSYHPE